MAAPLDYLLDRQISRQWRGLLSALADEFETQIGGAELRQLMHRVGSRFADASPLPPCASTAELADALNAVWREADWGFVELSDARDHLRLVHYCAPLRAFGDSALAWTPAYLEGAYQHWLSTMGADGLALRQHGDIGQTGDGAAIEFRLARGAA
ncbi:MULTISPECIES: cellulose biosynthesis protein BcsD [unclassified Caballeronia]|uniref:cellulose biosynthesis protein BcsD n=1 Tax=unclassified Caballeronia TaxID=2646786 RepID=UPI0028577BAE|nr:MULTISPECIES: cellulose biosynthesis protein BcsD [unclassified Caballeronia]MDR5739338.1 cellulose biosynthesis protein BcsD [Caballeronia sp. LZ016]MDR5807827.1 cellulose biosynthesis protein BcsD [Caballeronia sp. LZ019]